MAPVPIQFIELARNHFDTLSRLIPELNPPLFLWAASRRVAEETAFTDWRLPTSIYYRSPGNGIRIVTEPSQLYGVRGDDKILWECYGAWNCRNHLEIARVAEERGFTIKPDTEFFEWLMKRTQDLVLPAASDGWPALEVLRHKLPLQKLIPETKPAGKAQ